jgi:tetratricopeptide (TPR) repeat protein
METALIQSLTGELEHDLEIYTELARNNERLLAIDPFIPVPRSNLAVALYHMGQRERAMREVHQALEFEPNYVPGYLQIAGWYQAMGDQAEADRYRRAGFEIVNKYRDYQPTDAYIGLLLARPQSSWATLSDSK